MGDWVGGHPGANDLAPRPRGAPRTRPGAERGEYSEGARGKGALTAHPVTRETSTTIHRRPRGSGNRSAGPLRSPGGDGAGDLDGEPYGRTISLRPDPEPI